MDVIYRRIDDDFLIRKSSVRTRCSVVPGIVNAYRRGNVSLANSIGTGVADDKAIYYFVPRMIKFIWAKIRFCPTWKPIFRATKRTANISWSICRNWSVKAANESGGYGMLIGTQASAEKSNRSGKRSSRSRATTLRNRWWRYPVRRRSAAIAWKGATSICVRIFCTERSHDHPRGPHPRSAPEGFAGR